MAASPYIIGAPDVERHLYPNGIIEAYAVENPTYGLFPKKDILTEAGKELNWQLSLGSGDATSMSEAESDQSPGTHKRPFITRSREYSTATVDRETMMATQGKDAITHVWGQAMKDCVKKQKRQWGMMAYRDGTGRRAQLAASSSGVATATVTLANANDVKLFTIGMWVQGATFSGYTATLRNSGAKIQITGLNIGAGTLTAAAAWTGSIAALADGDYLGRSGDMGSSPGVVKGFKIWVPPNAPTTGDSFFGIDRSPYGEGAFGHRPTSTSSSLYNTGVDASAYLHDVGAGSPDIWLCNPMDAAAIIKELGGMTTMHVIPSQGKDGKLIGNIGYNALQVKSATGDIDIVTDPYIERGDSWMGTRESVSWWVMGDLIERITLGMGENGGYVTTGSDSISIRYGGFGQLVIENPYEWAYVALPTT